MATLYFTGTCDVVVADGVATITPTVIYNDAGVAVSTLYTRIKTGDRINCSAGCGIVAAVAADGTITSADGWYGATATGVKFNAQPMPAGSELSTSTRDALAWKNTLNSLVCVRAGEAGAVKELQKLDCLVGLYFTSMALAAPPSSYAAGATYLVGASATGVWAGYDGKIAYSRAGAAWEFYAPYNGLMAYNAADGAYYSYVAGAWAKKIAVLDQAQTWGGSQLFGSASAGTTLAADGTILMRNISPTALLTLNLANGVDGANFYLMGTSFASSGVYHAGGTCVQNNGTGGLTLVTVQSQPIYFGVGNTEVARITPTGGVGFGITDPATPVSNGTRNVAVSSAGQTNFKVLSSGQYAMMLFASGSSYATQGFAFADSTNNRVCIGTATNTPVQLNTNNAVRWEINGYDGILSPYIDNTYDVGRSDKRVRNYYGTTSSISTSWSERKTNVRAFSDAEIKCGLEILEKCPCVYQYKDAVASKGDSARLHTGYIADTNDTISIVSAIQTAFSNNGLDPLRYGLYCRDVAKKTVTKTRTVQKQKTETKSRTVETITVTDGKAVQTTASESYEEPVYETLAVVDADGTAVYNTAMITAADGTQTETKIARTYQKPVMVDEVEEYTEQVDDTNDDGSVKYAYSLRYSELHDFVIAALYQAHIKLTESVATLVAAAAAATSTTTTSTTDTSSTSSTATTSA